MTRWARSARRLPSFRACCTVVNVLEFNPINPLKIRKKLPTTQRDHRKVVVIDGKIGFTGGVNLSNVYYGSSSSLSGGPPTLRQAGGTLISKSDRPWPICRNLLFKPGVSKKALSWPTETISPTWMPRKRSCTGNTELPWRDPSPYLCHVCGGHQKRPGFKRLSQRPILCRTIRPGRLSLKRQNAESL